MSQLLKSSGAMSAATMLSRVLGLVRETVYARFMGDNWVADAFTLAFMVPNLFRRLLGEGILTAAFIPVFKEKEKTEGDAEMWRAANAVLSGLTMFAATVVILGIAILSALLYADSASTRLTDGVVLLQLGFPFVVGLSAVALVSGLLPARNTFVRVLRSACAWTGLTAAGLFLLALAGTTLVLFVDLHSGRTLLMLELLRVMFPYLLLVCVAAIYMGMLNARGHFFVPAMGATMLNVVMIASVLWLAPNLGPTLDRQIFGLAIGVVIAGFAQAAFQLPLLRQEGFRFQWISPWRDATVARVVKLMIPGTLGVAAFQLNVLITQSFAFSIDEGVVASFNYAVRLLELPQGVFGVSLATYLLPTLAGFAAEKKYGEFRATLQQGLGWLVFLNLLAGVLLFTLAAPIIRLLFQHGRFDESSTDRAALALVCLAPGLVAFSMVNILARAFYALGDTQTPMKISIVCLALNLLVALVLAWRFKQGGLGVANTFSSVVNVALLAYALKRKLPKIDFTDLRRKLPALLGATLVAGATAWFLARWWGAHIGHAKFGERLGEVFLPMAAASLVYLGLTVWLKTGHTDELFALVKARWKRKP